MSSRVLWSIIALLSALPAASAADDLSARAETILHEALTSKNPDTRKHAVVAMSLAASRNPYTSRLLEALKDKDVEVRVAAISSLTEAKSQAAIAGLRDALEDPVPEVSFAAAKALWSLNHPAGRRALMAVLEGETKSSSNFLSRQKRDALRMMHTPRTALIFAVRQGAAFAPVPGLGTGIASMQSLLTDPDLSGRAAAAMLLAQRKDRVVLNSLRDALHEKDASLRATAVHILALTNNTEYRKDIGTLLDDDKETVRLRAAAACIRLASVSRKSVPRQSTSSAAGTAAPALRPSGQ